MHCMQHEHQVAGKADEAAKGSMLLFGPRYLVQQRVLNDNVQMKVHHLQRDEVAKYISTKSGSRN